MDLRMPDFSLLPNQSQYHSVLPDTPKIQFMNIQLIAMKIQPAWVGVSSLK